MPDPSPQEIDENEAVQNDLARLDTYKNQVNILLRQQEVLRLSVLEHTRARDTLEGMDRLDGSEETLAPVGANTFVKVSHVSSQKVLIGIGTGVVVEVDREKALSMLNERVVALERSSKERNDELLRIDAEAQVISQRLEAAVRQQQQTAGMADDQ